MSDESVPYGGVIEIGGWFYSPGPEADAAREREAAKVAERERREAVQAEEAAQRERVERRYAPLLEGWPATRKALVRRREEARERLVAAIGESPVFAAFVEVLAAERAEHEGDREVRAARTAIDGKPRTQAPVRYSDLLEVLREEAERASLGVLVEARAAAQKGSG